MNKKWIVSALFVATSVATAHASVINYSSRYSNSGPLASGAAYKSLIDGLTAAPASAGYCDATLSTLANVSNHALCGGGTRDIAFHFQVLFGVAPLEAGSWAFRAGVDFGRGGAMFLDNVLIDSDVSDLWWAGNYTAASEVLAASGLSLTAGNHVLDIYGLEGCCDGAQAAQYQIGSQPWTTFAARDGHDQRVPLPATLALLGIGIAGLRFRRKS